MGGLIVLLIIYSRTLIARNEAFQRAGAIAQAIPLQVKAMHPTLPEDARLVFVGVPDRVSEGILVYLTGFQGSMELAYPSSKFQSWKFDKFPIWFDGLDRTHFFEVNHRRVTERADLVQQLEERKACSNTLEPILTWDFAHDTQGWEAWNDLSELQIRDGALTTVAQGKDPYIGSPTVDIPSIIMDSVEIEMRVQSEQPAAEGQLYWRVSGQQDFSPGLRISFQVQADGTFRTYTINLIESGMLLMDTRIEQFRLDPVDVPAHIAIKSVRVLSPCGVTAENRCTCER